MTTARRSKFTDADLEDARSWYYPGWWTHVSDAPNPATLPLYRVLVRSEDEEALARASQPPYVQAHFEFVRD